MGLCSRLHPRAGVEYISKEYKGEEMEHQAIEAEIKKKCEKCGFSGKEFPHVVCHRPPKPMYCYRGKTVFVTEAMVFICTRCSYEWEIGVT